MAVLPLVEDIEGEADATVDHQQGATPHPDGRDQANAMGAPLVDVEDVGLVPSQVFSQPRGGNRVPWASNRELEKWETCVDTGQLEITARTAPDPHVVPPADKALGRRQHLHNRPGGESVLIDQVEDAELWRHGRSIGVEGERHTSKISIFEVWKNPRKCVDVVGFEAYNPSALLCARGGDNVERVQRIRDGSEPV
jgi:hypothetical protein